MLAAVVLSSIALIGPLVIGAGSASASGRFEGNHIIVFFNNEQSFPANEPCYVNHGFVDYDWPTLSPAEKKNFLSDAVYTELFIDDQKIELKKVISFLKEWWSWADQTWYDQAMMKTFAVQFDAGHFTPGQTYLFHAIWHTGEGVVHDSTSTITFT